MKPKKRKIVNAIDTYETRYGTMKTPKRSKELEEILLKFKGYVKLDPDDYRDGDYYDGFLRDEITDSDIKEAITAIEKWAKERYGRGK